MLPRTPFRIHMTRFLKITWVANTLLIWIENVMICKVQKFRTLTFEGMSSSMHTSLPDHCYLMEDSPLCHTIDNITLEKFGGGEDFHSCGTSMWNILSKLHWHWLWFRFSSKLKNRCSTKSLRFKELGFSKLWSVSLYFLFLFLVIYVFLMILNW